VVHMNELVSVGIPAFNRSDRLVIALNSLLKQTYTNIEIIISDDCSTDIKVKETAMTYMAQDERIRYFRQEINIGPEYNFRWVLEQAKGYYFMWAADDDERSPDCISQYVKNIGQSGGVFSNYVIRDYLSNHDKVIEIPILSGRPRSREDLILFMNKPCPSMIYGLFRTEVARAILPVRLFDFWDFYFCQRLIHEYGFSTFKSNTLYYAGINGKYKLNPFNKKKFRYSPFFLAALPYVYKAGLGGLIRHLKFMMWIGELNKLIRNFNGLMD